MDDIQIQNTPEPLHENLDFELPLLPCAGPVRFPWLEYDMEAKSAMCYIQLQTLQTVKLSSADRNSVNSNWVAEMNFSALQRLKTFYVIISSKVNTVSK